MTEARPLPVADGEVGLRVLKGLARDRSLLSALSLMNQHVGNAFKITMPRFQPAVFVGAASSKQILVTDRTSFLWRTESDPVTRLLRQGILVVDGEVHDTLRGHMDPALHRKHVLGHLEAFWRTTDQVTASWRDGETRDMLVEMRRLALLILMGTLFRVDFAPDMDRLWHAVVGVIEYISPGLWIMWPNMPRPKYNRALRDMDDYLYGIIRQRRAELLSNQAGPVGARSPRPQITDHQDLLTRLVLTPGLTDDIIRDQLLTMLIAGHDTSTALLAWALTLLGQHPAIMDRARAEVDAVLGTADTPPNLDHLNRLTYLDQIIKETLRLYPPIHIGNRRAATDVNVSGYHVPAGSRVMYSIYLTHRDQAHWPDPDRFDPDRFSPDAERDHRAPYAYIPFGGGPRICIGATYAQIEAKVVLARLLQTFDYALLNGKKIRPYMGATLEPRPGVQMHVQRRAHG